MLLLLLACHPEEAATPRDTAEVPSEDAGGLSFVDATDDWGLTTANASALWAADLDGDGYPELVATDNGGIDEDLSAPHYHHLYMNRDDGNGHRVFEEATESSGLFARREGEGGRPSSQHIFVDLDGDGDLDCFAGVFNDPHTDPATHFPDYTDVLLNDGNAHFSFAPISEDLQEDMPLIGVTLNDFDGDGKLDAYLGLWYQNEDIYGDASWLNWIFGANDRLLLGNGDGTFTDASDEADIAFSQAISNAALEKVLSGDYARPAMGATSCDLDGDAYADVLAMSYGRQWNLQWMNDGEAHFEEVGRESGYAGDDNVDYSDNWYYTCYCWANDLCEAPSDPDFPYSSRDCASVAAGGYWNVGWDDQPANLNGNTFSTACADIDNDGDMDLWNAEIAHQWAGASSDQSDLLLNDGDGAFERLDREESGLQREPVVDPSTGAWDFGDQTAAVADLDNDGRKDLILPSGAAYYGNFLYLWRQWDRLSFYEAEVDAGVDVPTARGVVLADFDRDGDLDLVASSLSELLEGSTQDHRLWFYENRSPERSWLRVRLDGPQQNRTGVGARVEVTTGERVQVGVVDGGYGQHGLQMEPVLSFGLGLAEEVQSLTVTWPGGEREEFGPVHARQQVVAHAGGGVEGE